METSRRPLPLQFSIQINNTTLQRVPTHKHLGIHISHDLRWGCHVNHILSRAARQLCVLRRLRSSLSRAALCTFYKLYIRPSLEYASTAWSSLTARQIDRLERFQRKAAKTILRRPLFVPSDHDEILQTIGWPSLHSRRRYRLAVLGYRIAHGQIPQHLQEVSVLFSQRLIHYELRHQAHFTTPASNTYLFQHSPLFQAATIYNCLLPETRDQPSLQLFKLKARTELLNIQCPCSQHIWGT